MRGYNLQPRSNTSTVFDFHMRLRIHNKLAHRIDIIPIASTYWTLPMSPKTHAFPLAQEIANDLAPVYVFRDPEYTELEDIAGFSNKLHLFEGERVIFLTSCQPGYSN